MRCETDAERGRRRNRREAEGTGGAIEEGSGSDGGGNAPSLAQEGGERGGGQEDTGRGRGRNRREAGAAGGHSRRRGKKGEKEMGERAAEGVKKVLTFRLYFSYPTCGDL